MTRITRIAILCAGLALHHVASGQTVAPTSASAAPITRITIHADLGRDTISRHIYGQFAEHLGRGIYDGF